MKKYFNKILILALTCFGLFVFTSNGYAQSVQQETPAIVKQIKGISQADSDAFTVRFYDLSTDKRALLNGMVAQAYGKKNLAYDKTHLDILFKTVESYNTEKTRSYLQNLYKASGN